MLPCPSCQTPLGRAHGRYGLFACATCGGIWADQHASSELSRASDPSVSAVSQHVSGQARWQMAPNVPGRPCPACRAPLAPSTFGSVHLDMCPGHGTWFDRDELTRVMVEVQNRPPPPPEPRASQASSDGVGTVVAVGIFEVLLEIVAGLAG
jgi:Zn-finger nucleic acid-binding protein